MKGSFNLSEWALKHQSFVWYLMFVAVSYTHLTLPTIYSV